MVSSIDSLLLAFPIGTQELLIFAAIMLLLFGSTKLPALMRNMGRSINEFKAGIKEKPRDVPNVEDMSETKSSP